MGRNYSATAVDTTLSAAITSTTTNFSVVGTVGFPTAPFLIAVIDSPGSQEIMLVTGVTGTSLTVSRGYDSTTATAHPATAVVRHVASAIDFREASLHIDAVSGVHGVGAGSVVGTTTTQTLTNKNLTSGTNTFPVFLTGFLVPTGISVEWPHTATTPSGWLREDGGEHLISSYTALYNLLTTNGTVFPYGANTNGAGAAGSTHFRVRNRKGRVAVGLDAAQTEFDSIGETGGFKTHTLTVAETPAHAHTADNAGSHSHAAATGSSGSHNHSSGTTSVAGSHSHTGVTNMNGNHSHGGATGAGRAGTYNAYPTYVYDSVGWTIQAEMGGYSGRVMVSDYGLVDSHSHTITADGNHNHGIPADGNHSHTIAADGVHTHTISADGVHTHVINNTGGGGAHNNLQPYIVTHFIIKT